MGFDRQYIVSTGRKLPGPMGTHNLATAKRTANPRGQPPLPPRLSGDAGTALGSTRSRSVPQCNVDGL
jgi:hypothetical protein